MAEQIGRYKLGQRLGAGAHGAVWQAEDSLLGRTVALKLLKAGAKSQEGLNENLKEAQTLAKLNHPNIVTLYEVAEYEGQAYLVMEYLDGQSLTDYLASKPEEADFDHILKLIEQLVDALATAHAHGIVHADIKPANIIIRGDCCPVLVDFGLAKVADISSDMETVTNDSILNTMVHGTLAYMAPEVMRGDAADEKSDIFSLGAVLYELLYGERAFKAPSSAETIHQILNIDPEPAGDNTATIPPWAEKLVSEMLAKKREARLESFRSIQEILKSPEVYHPDENATSARQKRKKRLIIGGLLAATVALATIGTTQYEWQSPSVSGQINAGLENLRNFQHKGAISEAKSQFQAVLSADPENAAATAGYSLTLLAEYTDKEADPQILEAASAAATLALSLDNQLALAHTAKAWAEEYNGNFDEAKKSYQTALGLDPSNFLTLEGYGRFLSVQGEINSAIDVYIKAVSLYPETSAFYVELGENYRQLGKYEEAEKMLHTALELSPDDMFAYLTLSAVLYSKNDIISAIQIAQKGIQIRPHPRLYGNLGTFYFVLGQYPQSAKAFERAIDISGNSHDYLQWANLADAYRMIPAEIEKSKIAYKRALQLLQEKMSPDDTRPKFVSRASLYYAKAGELTEAKELAARALNLAPENSSVLFRAAIVHDLAGDRQLSLSLIKKALDSGYPLAAVKSEPDLSALRNDPLYHQLLAEREDT